jgi:SAM-dependent methyltransferase
MVVDPGNTSLAARLRDRRERSRGLARAIREAARRWRDRRAARRMLARLPARLHASSHYEGYLMAQLIGSHQKRAYVAHGRAEQLVELLREVTSPPARPLSALCVGCRNTHELEVMRRAGYAEVMGIDLFSVDRDILPMDMHCLAFPDRRFDVILACHSLEHALEPRRVLAEFQRTARPGAVCVIEVPLRPSGLDLQDFQSVSCLLRDCAPIAETILYAGERTSQPAIARAVFTIARPPA